MFSQPAPRTGAAGPAPPDRPLGPAAPKSHWGPSGDGREVLGNVFGGGSGLWNRKKGTNVKKQTVACFIPTRAGQ